MATESMNAATAFYTAACSVLQAAGETPTKSGIAKRIGEHRSLLQRRMNGKHDIGARKLQEWLRNWVESGQPAIEIRMTSAGALAVVLDQPEEEAA